MAWLVIKDDAILLEAYDREYGRDDPTLSLSMAKSSLSFLVDCAWTTVICVRSISR